MSYINENSGEGNPPITDDDLARELRAVQERNGDGAKLEIVRTIRKHVPAGKIYNCPPEPRPSLVADLQAIGCTPDAWIIVSQLVQIAHGHGGAFSLIGYGEDPKDNTKLPVQIKRIPNEGEPDAIYRQIGATIHALRQTPGMNVSITPGLVRTDLPEGARGGKDDMVAVLALAFDYDKPATADLPIVPHIVLATSPGKDHQWLLLDKPYPVAEVEPVIRALVEMTGADPQGKDVSHPFRLPGPNWPNAKKVKEGRSPEPFMAHITMCGDLGFGGYALSEIKAKCPTTLAAQEQPTKTETKFNWDSRLKPLAKPLTEDKIVKALENPKYAKDRSAGLSYFYLIARSRGHSPDEVVKMVLDHDTIGAAGKINDTRAPEKWLRKDVREWWAKPHPTEHVENFAKFENALNTTPAKSEISDPARPVIVNPAFPDRGNNGVVKATVANTRVAIKAFGLTCRYDEFHDKLLLGGRAINQSLTGLSDHAELMLRQLIDTNWGFDPKQGNAHDAVVQLCLQDRFDPVCDYLDGLQWDGVKRLDTWMVTYLGAKDTPFVRVVSRLTLKAAVRRARKPGCKFDQIIVLEGPEGKNKSSAIALLAGDPENFSDQSILTADDRKQQELLRGKWLYEMADLSGIRSADVEKVKAFASRSTDRDRRVFDRNVTEQPRRCILFATTNDDAYLKSRTGNRRFWPVLCGDIDLVALGRDRDQLWAEAAFAEAQAGASIFLPPSLYADATAEQAEREVLDPWADFLMDVAGVVCPAGKGLFGHARATHYEERISTTTLLNGKLELDPSQASWMHFDRLKHVMRKLGWEGPMVLKIDGRSVRGFRRPCEPPTELKPESDL